MRVPQASLAIGQVCMRLAEIFRVTDAHPEKQSSSRDSSSHRWDATISVADHLFVLEWKRSGSIAQVVQGTALLESAKNEFPDCAIPLLAVPFMGEAGQVHCAAVGQPWLDLSGNARILAPGIFYQNLGNKNRFRQAGRPASAFGSKGSRIARRLLMAPEDPVRQRALAFGTGLDEGHTSRVVAKLSADGLVDRGADGIRVTDWPVLLDAWREDYQFDRHQIFPGHISAQGGDRLIRAIADVLSKNRLEYAATALPAAWLLTKFAGFRLATVYLSLPPSEELKKTLAFREGARGANTWLVVPNDEGIFDGAEFVDGIRCAHPVQVYVDLKNHPERSAEAAQRLRSHMAPQFPIDARDDHAS